MRFHAGHFILMLVGGGFSIYWLTVLLKTLKTIRFVKDTPTSRIRDLKPGFGLVEIDGRVVQGSEKLLTAPISNAACVYYDTTIAERRIGMSESDIGRDGGRRQQLSVQWSPVVTAREFTSLIIDDGTGRVEVDLKGRPELILNEDEKFGSGVFNEAPEHVQKMLQTRYRVRTKAVGFNKNMRFRETFIAPGDRIYVIGEYRGEPPMLTWGGEIFAVADDGERAFLDRFHRRALFYGVGSLLSALIALVQIFIYLNSRR